jgi:threonine dehydrogenase-like Zn-dependent dehydrogenase
MPNWLINILGVAYSRIPVSLRPIAKRIFNFFSIRFQAVVSGRRVFRGNRVEFLDFEIAHIEPYEFLGPGKQEVLVEAHSSLVSPGTERAVLCGLPGARRSFPYIPGYSLAGTISRVGKGVTGFSVGERVTGRVHHVSRETVPANQLFRIPDGASFEDASFIELGIITLQGIRKATILPGDRVAVVGQGLIGQLSNKLARLVGASSVIAVAFSRNREGTARAGGAIDEYISLREAPARADELNADVVIEAVGTPEGITTALRCARVGGRVVLVGSSRGLSRDVDVQGLVQKKSIEIRGAHISVMPNRDATHAFWTYRQEGEFFLELLAAKRLVVSDLLTWVAKPSECNAVYETLAHGGRDHVGILFDWVGRG